MYCSPVWLKVHAQRSRLPVNPSRHITSSQYHLTRVDWKEFRMQTFKLFFQTKIPRQSPSNQRVYGKTLSQSSVCMGLAILLDINSWVLLFDKDNQIWDPLYFREASLVAQRHLLDHRLFKFQIGIFPFIFVLVWHVSKPKSQSFSLFLIWHRTILV